MTKMYTEERENFHKADTMESLYCVVKLEPVTEHEPDKVIKDEWSEVEESEEILVKQEPVVVCPLEIFQEEWPQMRKSDECPDSVVHAYPFQVVKDELQKDQMRLDDVSDGSVMEVAPKTEIVYVDSNIEQGSDETSTCSSYQHSVDPLASSLSKQSHTSTSSKLMAKCDGLVSSDLSSVTSCIVTSNNTQSTRLVSLNHSADSCSSITEHSQCNSLDRLTPLPEIKKQKLKRSVNSVSQSGHLTEHMKIPFEEKNFKCLECGKCYVHLKTLNLHLKIHSDNMDFKCGECGKCFTRNSELNVHLRSHSGQKDYRCGECGKWFRYRSNLNMHAKIHSGKKEYQCNICEKCFTHSGSLKWHLKLHSGVKDCKCKECGKCFSSNRGLRSHSKMHSDERDYICGECGKCFKFRSNLLEHLRTHSGKREYKCEECGKCFVHSSSLKYHVKRHLGLKEYMCGQCGKRFTHSSTLKCHLKIHAGIKDYKCEVCSKTFRHSCSLKCHTKVHGIEKE